MSETNVLVNDVATVETAAVVPPVVETPTVPVEPVAPVVDKTPVETPLTPVPPVEPVIVETPTVNARGRQPSQRTLAIRQMLDESNGEMTHSTALPLLLLAGYEEIDANGFNVIKSNWKKAREEGPVTVKVPAVKTSVKPKTEVFVLDAVKFIEESGGLVKAEAHVAYLESLIQTFKNLLKLAA